MKNVKDQQIVPMDFPSNYVYNYWEVRFAKEWADISAFCGNCNIFSQDFIFMASLTKLV